MLKLAAAVLSFFLMSVLMLETAVAETAHKFAAFEKACTNVGGTFRGNASGYEIPGEDAEEIGVIRCAIPTYTLRVSDGQQYATSNVKSFSPDVLNAFNEVCSGKIYITALSEFETVGIFTGSSKASLVIVCY